MKIRHSDQQWVGRLFMVLGIIIILILIGIMIQLLFFNNSKKKEDVKEKGMEYVTKQVLDYESDRGDKEPDLWEVRYDLLNLKSILYKNEKVKKEVKGESVDEIVLFNPENMKISSDMKEQMLENKETGIIYEQAMKKSESYVALLLDRGYRMKRKILTAAYAEVYLTDSVDNTVRIIAFRDKMLMAELYKNAEMPGIESYFN